MYTILPERLPMLLTTISLPVVLLVARALTYSHLLVNYQCMQISYLPFSLVLLSLQTQCLFQTPKILRTVMAQSVTLFITQTTHTSSYHTVPDHATLVLYSMNCMQTIHHLQITHT